jgi:hypothetical protein
MDMITLLLTIILVVVLVGVLFYLVRYFFPELPQPVLGGIALIVLILLLLWLLGALPGPRLVR